MTLVLVLIDSPSPSCLPSPNLLFTHASPNNPISTFISCTFFSPPPLAQHLFFPYYGSCTSLRAISTLIPPTHIYRQDKIGLTYQCKHVVEIVMLAKAVYRININSNVIFFHKLDKIIQNSHGNTGDHREQKKFIA